MKTIIGILQLAGIIALTSFSCKQSERSEDPVEQNGPYPKVEDQRKALANRTLPAPYRALDSAQLLNDLAYFASPACEGRRPGTPGHELAFQRILQRFRTIGVDSIGGSLIQSFAGRSLNGYTEGRNVVGLIRGSKHPDRFIVLTAHYDHLGPGSAGNHFAGADDNASGTSAVLAIAAYLEQHQPDYSVILALLDREETGLEGAYALVEKLKQNAGTSNIVFNLNLDMVARSDRNELFVCGVKYRRNYAAWVEKAQQQSSVNLLMGHDGAWPGDDWTSMSDHFAFHKQGIPFLYLGVEDHQDYHKPGDTFDKVNPSGYLENCNTILVLLKTIDANL